VRTLHHVYTSPLHLPMVLSHGITPEPIEPRHCILDFWSSLTVYGHPPSHYVLAPHSFYNYIRIQTHHVSNQHATVISPDHRHAHISCCIVTGISPRNLLCALPRHFNLARSLERAPPFLPRHSEFSTLHPIVSF
jgi:hypothetical protein